MTQSAPSTDTAYHLSDEVFMEFEIDFIAATYMFGGMSYERAREKAVEEWMEFNNDH